jgi:hypothetical protein
LKESAFYGWRGRLWKQTTPVRFVLVETKPAVETPPPLELLLASGDRLRIPSDAATLKLVAGAAGTSVIRLAASVRVYLWPYTWWSI